MTWVDAPALFDRGQTMEQFVQTTTRQRESWIRNVAAAKIDPGMVERFRRVGGDLRLLIVAKDWCPTPCIRSYVAALAAQAGVDMRIVDRGSGAAMMKRHATPDGRGVTPIVVLLRAVSTSAPGWSARLCSRPRARSKTSRQRGYQRLLGGQLRRQREPRQDSGAR